MQFLHIRGIESFYNKKYKSTHFIQMHRSTVYSYQFSKMTRGQVAAFFALVFVGIDNENAIPYDISWINLRSFCKVSKGDIELFQALNLIFLDDVDLQYNINKVKLKEVNINKFNLISENETEEKLKTATSFLQKPEIQNPKTNPNSPVREKLVSRYENLSADEIEKFKQDFGMDPSKYLSQMKSI